MPTYLQLARHEILKVFTHDGAFYFVKNRANVIFHQLKRENNIYHTTLETNYLYVYL